MSTSRKVSLVDVQRDGGIWFSFASFEGDRASTSLMNLAHGYLKAAQSVAERVEEEGNLSGVYELIPALFNLHQGIELFLKGVIHQLTGKIRTTHNLRELRSLYEKVTREEGFTDLALKLSTHTIKLTIERSGSPTGVDLRFIVDEKGNPKQRGITLTSKPIVDASHDCRREFARIRRILENVKGWSPFWEEGTFSRNYPDHPLWFFCIPGTFSETNDSADSEHRVKDARGRDWLVYEGEAITIDNCFELTVGEFPRGAIRIKCSLNKLQSELSNVSTE